LQIHALHFQLRRNELEGFDSFRASERAITNGIRSQGYQHAGADQSAHHEQPCPK
jgi:hypothetical protein